MRIVCFSPKWKQILEFMIDKIISTYKFKVVFKRLTGKSMLILYPVRHIGRLHAKEPKFSLWCKVSLTNNLKVFLAWRIWISYFHTLFSLNCGVIDIILVFHVGDWGSIPHCEGFILFSFFCPIFTHFWGFLNPKKGVTLPSYTYGTFAIQPES